MKKLFIFILFFLWSINVFGQEQKLPTGATWNSITNKSLVDKYLHYKINPEEPLFHVGWSRNETIFLLSYESGFDNPNSDFYIRDVYLYQQNYEDITDHWIKATKEPILSCFKKKNTYHYLEVGFTTIHNGGISRVEYLEKWDVYLVLLQMNINHNCDNPEKYIHIVPIFFVPRGKYYYKAFVFEPINKFPEHLYYVMNGGIQYIEDTNQYEISFSRDDYKYAQEFTLKFEYKYCEVSIMKNFNYESNFYKKI